jgi:hypothetical protein
MNKNVEFEMVCGDCGSLAIKIENPVSASRKTIVYCGECGASRGTVGALIPTARNCDSLGIPICGTTPRSRALFLLLTP